MYDNKDNTVADTSSAKRILNAKLAFFNVLEKASLNEILIWKKIIDNAIITNFEVTDKIQATQIFAFQNDRGKDLTTLEKLKAFLMHKIYAVSENPESLIKNLEQLFSDIYKQSERISYDEDQVLNFHNTAFLSGWESPLKNVKDELNKILDNQLKENWIKDFVNNLKETFLNIEDVEKQSQQNCSVADILLLDTANTMPLLLKLYHYHKNEFSLIEQLAKLVEKILFKLECTVANYKTNSLNNVSKHYLGDSSKLQKDLQYYVDCGFQHWWDFTGNCKNYFNSTYHYDNIIKYVLWKYENYLREKNRTRLISPPDFKNKFDTKRLENTTDHITPQNPNFTTYSDDFKNNYLNDIGNLVLMVWGDNSEKSNNNPVDKVNLFDSDYYSHKEIRDVLTSKKNWGEQEIKDRKGKILAFISEIWGI